MTKHRILIVTNRIPYPLNDGGSIAMYAMIEGYHNAGWEVFLCSLNTSRHYVNLDALPPFFQKIGFESLDINTDVRVFSTLRNFFLSRKPNHAERFYEKEFAHKLKRIINTFEPDVVQLESVYLTTYLPVIQEAGNILIALRLHNIEYQIWERLANEASSFKKYYLRDLCTRIRKFEMTAWSSADLLITITDADAAVVRKLVKDTQIVTAPLGINAAMVPAATGQEQWVGYHIGAMDWLPNTEAVTWFLDQVWPDLHKEVPLFEFHFAGRNMPGAFEKYEHDGVTCAGEVPDAGAFIADKKILIVPLRSGGGIRVKILEALAAGKLVISTATGMQGIGGARPGGHYLLADDKEGFIRQIKWALDHKSEAADIARAGAELIRSAYDQESIMRTLIHRAGQMLAARNI